MLNVLVPPRIVEQETTESRIQVDEFGNLTLNCKVISEPQSQLMWRREDGGNLDGLEQRFSHKVERKSRGRIKSIDSSELIFNPVQRFHAASYLVSQSVLFSQ